MPVIHTNRKGQTYTLYQGKTKTGKPKYYLAKKPSPSGTQIDAIPEGYEIRESPATAVPSVRKIKPCRFTAAELNLVQNAVQKNDNVLSFIIDGDGNAITIYISEALVTPAALEKIFGVPIPGIENWNQYARYSPEMRFNLIDQEKRLFSAQRWCYRGSIDNWFPIGRTGPLPQLVEQFTPHLRCDSFFELM